MSISLSLPQLLLLLLPLMMMVMTVSGQHVHMLPSGAMTMNEGGDISLQCTTTHDGTLAWYHDNVPLAASSRVIIHVTDMRRSEFYTTHLSVIGVHAGDAGMYTCKDPRDFLMKVDIHVTVRPSITATTVDITEPEGRSYSVEKGKYFTLKCVAGPGADLIWIHAGSPLRNRASRVIIHTARDITDNSWVTMMTRRSAVLTDGGQYVCHDVSGRYTQDMVIVNVRDTPTDRRHVEIMEPTASFQEVAPGQRFTIKCLADRQALLVWYKDDHQIQPSEGFLIDTTPDLATGLQTSLLTREAARREDTGDYLCRNAHVRTDQDSVMIRVVQGDPSPGYSNQPGRVSVVEMRIGATTSLECSLEAPGEVRAEWLKDGVTLISDDKFNINRHSSPSILGIRNANRADAGIYTCVFKHRGSGLMAGSVAFNVTTVRCPQLSAPVNGSLSQCPQVPVYGESCAFRCRPGLTLSHSSALMCEIDDMGRARWSQYPPTCQRYQAIGGATSMPFSVSEVLLRVGEPLELHCADAFYWVKDDHTLEHGQKYVIRKNKLLIQHTRKNDEGVYNCIKEKQGGFPHPGVLGINKFNVTTKSCPRLSPPLGGSLTKCSPTPVYGETCQFRCGHGYRLTGSMARTCELAESQVHVYWTGAVPRCMLEDEYNRQGEKGRHSAYPSTAPLARWSQCLWTLLIACYLSLVLR